MIESYGILAFLVQEEEEKQDGNQEGSPIWGAKNIKEG